jgi:hypothetical protein
MTEAEVKALRAALDFCNAVDTSEQAPRELSVMAGEVRRKIMIVLKRWDDLADVDDGQR